MTSNSSRRRSGFTLVELAVVVSIVSLLAFLSLSALQNAREVARRMECSNHLKQLGLALHNYTSTHSVFPAAHNGLGYSLFSMILAFEENVNVYNSINFDGSNRSRPSGGDPNFTAATTRLGVLLCPSDPKSARTRYGSTNYAGNCGTEFMSVFLPYSGNGAFTLMDYLPPSGVTDGLTHTAAMSEWLVGDKFGTKPRDVRRLSLRMPGYVGDATNLAEACEGLDPRDSDVTHQHRGLNWLHGSSPSSIYNHIVNNNGNSCYNNGHMDSAWTSGSFHPGGVNVLYCDGHVDFVKSSVERRVWRAMGTRNGGD